MGSNRGSTPGAGATSATAQPRASHAGGRIRSLIVPRLRRDPLQQHLSSMAYSFDGRGPLCKMSAILVGIMTLRQVAAQLA